MHGKSLTHKCTSHLSHPIGNRFPFSLIHLKISHFNCCKIQSYLVVVWLTEMRIFLVRCSSSGLSKYYTYLCSWMAYNLSLGRFFFIVAWAAHFSHNKRVKVTLCCKMSVLVIQCKAVTKLLQTCLYYCSCFPAHCHNWIYFKFLSFVFQMPYYLFWLIMHYGFYDISLQQCHNLEYFDLI